MANKTAIFVLKNNTSFFPEDKRKLALHIETPAAGSDAAKILAEWDKYRIANGMATTRAIRVSAVPFGYRESREVKLNLTEGRANRDGSRTLYLKPETEFRTPTFMELKAGMKSSGRRYWNEKMKEELKHCEEDEKEEIRAEYGEYKKEELETVLPIYKAFIDKIMEKLDDATKDKLNEEMNAAALQAKVRRIFSATLNRVGLNRSYHKALKTYIEADWKTAEEKLIQFGENDYNKLAAFAEAGFVDTTEKKSTAKKTIKQDAEGEGGA